MADILACSQGRSTNHSAWTMPAGGAQTPSHAIPRMRSIVAESWLFLREHADYADYADTQRLPPSPGLAVSYRYSNNLRGLARTLL